MRKISLQETTAVKNLELKESKNVCRRFEEHSQGSKNNQRTHPTQDFQSNHTWSRKSGKKEPNGPNSTTRNRTTALQESATHRIPMGGRRPRCAQKRKLLAANHRILTRGRQRRRRRVCGFAVVVISAASRSDNKFDLFPLPVVSWSCHFYPSEEPSLASFSGHPSISVKLWWFFF